MYIYIYTKKIIHSLQIITAMSTESFPQITLTSYQSSFIWSFNPLCANLTKWSNKLKLFVGCSRRIV